MVQCLNLVVVTSMFSKNFNLVRIFPKKRSSIRKDSSDKVRIDSFRAHHWNEDEPLSVILRLGNGSVIAGAFIEVIGEVVRLSNIWVFHFKYYRS